MFLVAYKEQILQKANFFFKWKNIRCSLSSREYSSSQHSSDKKASDPDVPHLVIWQASLHGITKMLDFANCA